MTPRTAQEHGARRLLSPDEAAAFLGMPVETLRHWRNVRRGPAFVRVGRCVRYRPDDLDEFIAGNRVEPQGAA